MMSCNSRFLSFAMLPVAVLFLILANDAYALTLQEAHNEALKANLGIKSTHEKTVQADELSYESYTKLFPVVSLLGQTSYASEEDGVIIGQGAWGVFPFGPIPAQDSRVVSEENNIAYTGAIRVQQPIFTGGRIWFNYKSMQSQHDEARLNEEQFVQEILLNTEKAYFTLLKTQERLLIAEAHRVAVAEQLSDMEKRYKYGRVNLNDLLKSRVQLADADSELLKAKNGVLVAEGQMNLLLNRPLEQPVKAVSVGDPPQVTLSSAAAKELAKLANKALNSARQKRLTAEFQRRIAEADYYPSISFTGQYNAQGGMANYRDTWWFAGISLEWNIWQWGGTRSKVNAAKAFERQVEYDVSSLENKTVIEVRDAYLLISEADQRVIADRESVKQAEENLRITKIGYQSGRNTATELLKAEDLVVQAKGTLVQDMYEAHVSRAQLRFIMGKMESLDFLTFRTIEPATEEKRPAPAVPVQQDRAAVPAQPGDTLYAEAAE